jgi:hypothetical protein
MSRNRKSQPAAVRFGPVLKAMLLFLVIGGSGVGYVWQKDQIYELAQQKKRDENRLEELRRQNKLRNDLLTHLSSLPVLAARVQELDLGLVPAQPEQILRLVESAPGQSVISAEREYAQGRVPVMAGR